MSALFVYCFLLAKKKRITKFSLSETVYLRLKQTAEKCLSTKKILNLDKFGELRKY